MSLFSLICYFHKFAKYLNFNSVGPLLRHDYNISCNGRCSLKRKSPLDSLSTVKLCLHCTNINVPDPLIYVMRSVKTRRTSQNAKLSFWSYFKAKSELFSELFKCCLYGIHIQSYNKMMLNSSILLYTSFLTISSHFSKCCFATSDGFSQIASHMPNHLWYWYTKSIGIRCLKTV